MGHVCTQSPDRRDYCAAHAKGLAPSKCSGVFLLVLTGARVYRDVEPTVTRGQEVKYWSCSNRLVLDVVPAGVPKTFWLVLEVPDRSLFSREGEEGT